MTAVAPASFAALVVVVAVGLAEGVGRPPPARAVASRSHESDASMAGRAPHASMAGRAGGDRWLGAASGCAADVQRTGRLQGPRPPGELLSYGHRHYPRLLLDRHTLPATAAASAARNVVARLYRRWWWCRRMPRRTASRRRQQFFRPAPRGARDMHASALCSGKTLARVSPILTLPRAPLSLERFAGGLRRAVCERRSRAGAVCRQPHTRGRAPAHEV